MFNSLGGWMGVINVLMGPMLISFLATGREDLIARFGRRLVPQLVLLAATGAGAVVAIAPAAFGLVFGSDFAAAGLYFQPLLLGLVFGVTINAYSGAITAFKLIKLGIAASIARGAVNLLGDFLLVPILGSYGAAVSTAAGIAVAALLCAAICARRMKCSLMWQFALSLPMLLALAVANALPLRWSVPLGGLLAIACGYILARAYRIFKPEDISFLDHVQMPARIRGTIARTYQLLVRLTGGAAER
jgi:O-antigen/teichoic acid export membrane protein